MLLNRPHPQEGELLPQYILRLTIANGYHKTQAIMKLTGERLLNTRIPANRLYFGDFDINALAKLVNLNKLTLMKCALNKTKETRFSYLGQHFLLKAFSFNFLKVCPHCFADQPEVSLINSLSIKTVCVKHHCQLIKTHPETGKKLNWGTPYLNRDIPNWKCIAKIDQIENAELAINTDIEDLLYGKTKLDYPFTKALNLAEYIDLINLLNHYHQRTLDKRVSSKYQCHYRYTHQYLIDWPHSFNNLLDYFQRNPMADSRLTGIRKCYRDLYDDIYSVNNSGSSAYKLLRYTFEKYIRENFDNGTILNSNIWLSRQTVKKCQYLNEKQACALLNVPQSRLKLYIREGIVKIHKNIDNGKNIFERNHLKKLKRKLERCYSLSKTSQILGISKNHVKELIKDRIIKALLSRTKENRDWLIEESQIEGLISKLKKRSTNSTVLKGKNIRSYNHLGLTINKVVYLMFKAAITFNFSKNIHYPYSLTQFYPIITEHYEDGLFTPKEVSKRLNICLNAVYDLIQRGFIECIKTTRGKSSRKLTLIPKSSIDDFRSNFYFESQINQKCKSKFKLISGSLIDGGIVNIYTQKAGTTKSIR